MKNLEGQKVVVTGGSRGLGLGIVEALVARKAQVTVVARDPERLAEVSKRLGVKVVRGDVTDEKLARGVLSDVRPSVLVLNAGATPPMGPLHELSWENFSRAWDVDVKAGFHWMQETLRLPLPRGSRVIIASSGAALNGSPLSGSYAGAKRMLWLMALYANDVAQRLDLGIRFQAILPAADHRRHRTRAHRRPRPTRGARASASKSSSPGSARRCRRARSATTSCRSSPIRATRLASRSA